MKKLIQQSGVVIALATALWVPGRLQGAVAPSDSSLDQTNMTQLCQQWMAMHQKMQAEIAAQDEELRQLVAQMNSAPAEQKSDAMAAVINKLVEQRLASHQRKEAMGSRMLQHLMQAMLEGSASGTNGTAQQSSGPTSQPVPPPNTQPSPPPPR